jgi:peptide/nickel transport system substrate-binding protein
MKEAEDSGKSIIISSQSDMGISRRNALKGLGALGLMTAAPFGLLGTVESAYAASGQEATPIRGGKIRVAGSSVSTADTLDPIKGSYSVDYSRHNMFYNGLTAFDEKLMPQMALAVSMDSDDLVTWQVNLRKDVIFHDNKPLTANDVVFSLLRHKDPVMGSKAKSLADQFIEVSAVSPSQVKIVLSAPNAELPSVLAVSHFLIIREGTKDFSKANGTGPFMCAEFTPGVRTVGVRNPNYWKPGKPYLDEIELIGIGDEPARVNALLAGDVHLIAAINPRSAQRIESSANASVLETTAGSYTNLIMRLPNRPFDNPDVVEAMKLLLDREQILKTVYLGYGVIGNDQPVMPGTPYYFDGLPQRVFDPEKAKSLLAKAGIANARLPLVTSGAVEGGVEMAAVYQQAARQGGLNLAINRVPSDGYWNSHWLKDPLCFGTINGRPTANMIMSQFFKSDAPWNESAWKNDQFDQLLIAARGEKDFAARKQMYADMQVLIHQHSGIGLPVFSSNLDAYSKKLKGLHPIPVGALMGFSFAENAWLQA